MAGAMATAMATRLWLAGLWRARLRWRYGGYGYGYGGYGYPYYGGYGLTSWTYGPSLYDWGYSSYYNPYTYGSYGTTVATTVVVQPAVYNYAQPINTLAAPPDPGVTQPGDHGLRFGPRGVQGGQLLQGAGADRPGDPPDAQRRGAARVPGSCLFALQRYDESAAVLYAVLTAGPGWDWATLCGLYPNVSVYTQQLRALEAYRGQNPSSAPARFVLAYHYLTEGHTLASLQQLKEVASLQPRDGLAPQLARQLEPSAAGMPAGPASGPAPRDPRSPAGVPAAPGDLGHGAPNLAPPPSPAPAGAGP